jgi:hypothetical protein
VQIGGGVRVGDAFLANVGSRLIAIWVTIELCQNFSSEAGGISQALNKGNSHKLNRRQLRRRTERAGKVCLGRESSLATELLFGSG